jgi:Zn-dependent protease
MADEFELLPSQKAKTGKKDGARWGILGVLAVLFAKFKFLLMGLFKLKTLLSMLLFFAVYWNQWGWPFALGIVLSIYIHEMGHVATLKHYGIEATAPLFIPFVGAFIRVKQAFADPIMDARVGLAGPFWGLGAAAAAYAGYLLFQLPILAAVARTGAFINLFNLIPFWQLDGGRGFHSLNRTQRWLAFASIGLALFLTQQRLLFILLGFALFQCLRKQVPAQADNGGLFQYVFLVLVLSALCRLPVPGVAEP